MIYDKGLLTELDLLRDDMKTHNQDLLVSVWGPEGTGKSTFAANLAVYLDPTFRPDVVHDRVAQTMEDYARTIPHVKPLQVGWWDEAHRFGKRGQNDTDLNRQVLEYLQDIRAAQKIQIYCFPELQEIDRKVIQRSRLFFETVKKGEKFYVRGWTKQQVRIMIRLLRLANRKSLMEAWIGVSRDPKRVFRCDYKNFPNPDLAPLDKVMEKYKELKEGSVRRTEEKMLSYGYYDPIDIAKELMRRTTMSYEWAKVRAYDITKFTISNEVAGIDEIEKIGGRYKIKTKELFDNMVYTIMEKVQDSAITIPMDPPVELNNTNIQLEPLKPREKRNADALIIN
jgi:hypothetical protein